MEVMKKSILTTVFAALALTACVNMDLTPNGQVYDDYLLASEEGLTTYMARLISLMPYEDFRYDMYDGKRFAPSGNYGYNFGLGCFGTGEGMCKGEFEVMGNNGDYEDGGRYWADAFKLIHDANHLIKELPNHVSTDLPESVVNEYIGNAYFMRAFAQTSLARRYGGIPLVLDELNTEGVTDPAELDIPRASEEETWDQILKDFDTAISLLGEKKRKDGYYDKYIALSYKAETALYAACIAKYNDNVPGGFHDKFGRKTGVRVIGFDPATCKATASRYFSQAYEAAKKVIDSGKYALKMPNGTDKQSIIDNYVSIFDGTDVDNCEHILLKKYNKAEAHGWDSYGYPWKQTDSYKSSKNSLTYEFIRTFEGFPRYGGDETDLNDEIRVTDGNSRHDGTYLEFDHPMDFFENAEPRLQAIALLPYSKWNGQEYDVRAAVWDGEDTPKALHPEILETPTYFRFQSYPYFGTVEAVFGLLKDQVHPGVEHIKYTQKPGNGDSQITKVYLPAGYDKHKIPSNISILKDENGKEYINATGTDGVFQNDAQREVFGVGLRKWLSPEWGAMAPSMLQSTQPFVMMRYADVLLIAAEAGVELSIAGEKSPAGDDMLATATDAINQIRKRAGCKILLNSKLSGDENSRNIVRRERRKEICFDHKSQHDLRRWRVQDKENRDGIWGIPAKMITEGDNYACLTMLTVFDLHSGKWFIDIAPVDYSRTWNFKTSDYYIQLNGNEVGKSNVLDQQP